MCRDCLLSFLSPLGSGVYQVWQHTLPSPGQTCCWGSSCGCAQGAEVDVQNLWKWRAHSAVSFPLRVPVSCGRAGRDEYQDFFGSEKSWDLTVGRINSRRDWFMKNVHSTAAPGEAVTKKRIQVYQEYLVRSEFPSRACGFWQWCYKATYSHADDARLSCSSTLLIEQ